MSDRDDNDESADSFETEARAYFREMRELDLQKTLRNLTDMQLEHQHKDDLFHAEMRGEFRGLSMRVSKLEDKDRALEDSDKELADKLETSQSWTRDQLTSEYKKKSALADKLIWAIGSALVTAIGTILGYFFMKGHP